MGSGYRLSFGRRGAGPEPVKIQNPYWQAIQEAKARQKQQGGGTEAQTNLQEGAQSQINQEREGGQTKTVHLPESQDNRERNKPTPLVGQSSSQNAQRLVNHTATLNCLIESEDENYNTTSDITSQQMCDNSNNKDSSQNQTSQKDSSISCNNVNKTTSVNYLGCKVINLSKTNLTNAQVKVLEKGITFVPTPDKVDLGEIQQDVSQFLRRVILKVFFHNDENDLQSTQVSQSQTSIGNNPQGNNQNTNVTGTNPQVNNSSERLTESNTSDKQSEQNCLSDSIPIPGTLYKFKPKSKWTPRITDPTLSAFCNNVKNDLLSLKPNLPTRSNLSNKESRALSELKKNRDIIIKKADKGSSVVVMNKDDYIQEGLRQLSDTNYYIPQDEDRTKEFHEHIQKLIIGYENNGNIEKDMAKCLKTTEYKTASFYLLPKIHKVKTPGEFPPGRPIISANGCPTERISAFVDENIKGAVPKLKSHIKDTTDFIHKVENLTLPQNHILVTFDVVSLYTNIPNNEGIKSVAKSLRKNPPTHTTSRVVLQLLKEVLSKNNFEFNGQHYLQVGGTAMGTKLAPSYANIFMGDVEEKILNNCVLKPFFWVRFIDDIFAIWTEGEESLTDFHNFINTQHHSIKFTMEKSTEKIVFLDTWVKSNGSDKLSVELYSKPTDTHNYLHFSSYHQTHTKRGGPFGQFLRVRRNCTSDEDYAQHSQKMQNHYLVRGYPAKHVEAARIRAQKADRKNLIDPSRRKQKQSKNIVPLVLTHHPSNPQVQRIIMKHWGILNYSEKCKAALPDRPLFTTRRGKNLKDMLIKSRLANQQDQDTGNKNKVKPCVNPACQICFEVKMSPAISSISMLSYPTPRNCLCSTVNVIYLLTCSVCQKQYVGETKRAFKVRYKEHCKDLEFNRDKPVVNHALSHKGMDVKLIPQILEVIKKNPDLATTTAYRKRREVHWIYTLRTMSPEGLNTLG